MKRKQRTDTDPTFMSIRNSFPATYMVMERTATEVANKLRISQFDAMTFVYRRVVGRPDPIRNMRVLRGMNAGELREYS